MSGQLDTARDPTQVLATELSRRLLIDRTDGGRVSATIELDGGQRVCGLGDNLQDARARLVDALVKWAWSAAEAEIRGID